MISERGFFGGAGALGLTKREGIIWGRGPRRGRS